MTSYRHRPIAVEAMYFDGTLVGAREVIEWIAGIAPEVTVRQRVEYRGWADRIGHVELEIRDHDDQCASGDWIVLEPDAGAHRIDVLDSAAFHRRFEEGPR